MVWALAYRIAGAAPSDTGLVYFAFVNCATLGYGDVVPVRHWQLLGPITAMNGVSSSDGRSQSFLKSCEERW
jgi:hypothetical protein